MRITHVETYAARIPLKPIRRMKSALGQHLVSQYVLVRLGTDAGIEGVGEATVMPRWSGETVWSAKALIDRIFAPLVVGRDPTNIVEIDGLLESACQLNWFTKAAIEMACWDIAGKAAGKPVYDLLGGAQRALEFRCRFSMGAYDLDRARQVAADRVAAGFDTIKVKVGGDVAADLARVRAVREVIGPSRRLVIDANCGWDAETAVRAVNAMAELEIDLDEQPTTDGDYAAMARVRRETKPPVMADDICFDMVHARELVRGECCDVISVYPGKNGGIARAKAIVDFAASHDVACSIGSNLEWDVATAAMCHLVVACKNVNVERYPGDVLGPEYHEFSIARAPIKIRGDRVTTPSGPGLGVEVDWNVVRANLCA
ncbi:MAG: muconate cycloisomerase [Planctomycetia bacterium]|nr:muconate cycloisomerase [Planctomycetia bacterium]